MAGAFADITAEIKDVYSPRNVEPLCNNDLAVRPWLKKSLPSDATHEKGGFLIFMHNSIGSQGVGQTVDGSALPPAYDRTDVRLTLKPTLFAGAIEVGLMSSYAVNSATSGFNKGELARQTNDMIAFLGKFIDSTYAGTHGTGRRARVESDGSNNFVAALPEGVKLLRPGYLLSGRSTDAGSVSGSFDNQRCTAIATDTRTVTYAGTDRTLTAGDHIHVVTAASQTLTSVAANGFRGLFDDATYLASVHGQARSSYPKLKSIVNSNGGTLRNLSESILLDTAFRIQEASGKAVTDIWASRGQAMKWVEFLAPDKRFNVSSREDTGGKALGYKQEDLVFFAPGIRAKFNLSYDIVPREMYLLNSETIWRYAAKDMGWLDVDGMLHLSPSSGGFNASILGYMCAIENIGCDWFEANGVIRDLADPECGD